MHFKRIAAAAMTIVFAFAVSSGSAFAAEKDDVVAAVARHGPSTSPEIDRILWLP